MGNFVRRTLWFDRYALDLVRGCLRSADRELELRPKVFTVLQHLVENAGRLVTKDELQKVVWRDVVVTDDSLVQCILQLRQALDDHDHRLIKTVSRRGYVLDTQIFDHDPNQGVYGPRPVSGEPFPLAPPLALPDKPSIAILPFQNMSGDREQDYFADGLTEDITTALSRIHSLFVIARNSSFAYKGKAIDIGRIGREFGVRYLLEGSVQKAGRRLRITGQLIEAETRAHLWADKFDSVLEDVFDLQDRVTMAVAGAIEPSVTQAEIRRASNKPTESLHAYDWLLRARGEQQLLTKDGFARAMEMARRAIELDPRYAHAHSSAAAWTAHRQRLGFSEAEEAETAEGVRLAHLAVQMAPNDPVVLTDAAAAVAHLNRDRATAISWFDHAIALNPNSAQAFGRGAIVRNHVGDYATAIDHANRAMRLSPFDTYAHMFSLARGSGHLFQRQLPEAVVWLRKASLQNPRHLPTFLVLASALAHVGQMEEARAAVRRLLELQPNGSVRWERKRRLALEDDFEYAIEGARLAGLPE